MSRKMRICLTAALLTGLALAAAGCCTLGLKTCTATDVLTLIGGRDLNPCGAQDQSHPVAVRFLALKNPQTFQQAGFDDLWNDAEGVLRGDLVGEVREHFVAPGSNEDVTLVRGDGVTALGVLVNFCSVGEEEDRRRVFLLGGKSLKKTINLRDNVLISQ